MGVTEPGRYAVHVGPAKTCFPTTLLTEPLQNSSREENWTKIRRKLDWGNWWRMYSMHPVRPAGAVELPRQYGRKTCLTLAELHLLLLFTSYHMTPIESHVMILQSVPQIGKCHGEIAPDWYMGRDLAFVKTAMAKYLSGTPKVEEEDAPRNPFKDVIKSEHDTRCHLFNDIVSLIFFF